MNYADEGVTRSQWRRTISKTWCNKSVNLRFDKNVFWYLFSCVVVIICLPIQFWADNGWKQHYNFVSWNFYTSWIFRTLILSKKMTKLRSWRFLQKSTKFQTQISSERLIKKFKWSCKRFNCRKEGSKRVLRSYHTPCMLVQLRLLIFDLFPSAEKEKNKVKKKL